MAAAGVVAPGQLAPQRELLAEVRDHYPWDPASHVAAHNDPNQANLLFDGTRLWLVDWETAKRNDPYVDLATLVSHLAPTPDLVDALLRAATGTAPDAVARARLHLAGLLVQLFAGSMLLLIAGDRAAPGDLAAAPTTERFLAQVAAGERSMSDPGALARFAESLLVGVGERADAAATRQAYAALG